MAASGKGLGKGLSALFGDEIDEGSVKGIKIRDISPNPNQPRREFDPVALSELENSIRENGVITPITLRKTGDTYQIIAGERRWRAARAAGLSEIPSYVIEVDEQDGYALALIENLQRQDLNPIEEALGYKKLIEEHGLSQDMAGQRVGRSRSYISNALRLLNLPHEITEMIASGALSAGHGRALVTLPDPDALAAAKLIIERELSVRETEKLVKKMSDKESEKPKKESVYEMYAQDLARSLSSATAHKITINHGKKKGKLTIEYYGNEDLEQICNALEKIKNK